MDSITAEDAANSGGGETFHHSVLWLRADDVTEQGHYCRRELHYDGGVLAMPDTELIAAFGTDCGRTYLEKDGAPRMDRREKAEHRDM